jgi:hypothetical protein
MGATIFGYVILFTLLLLGAAAAVEWGMQGRVAIRRVWTVAILFALVAPPVALVWHAVAGARATADRSARADARTEPGFVTSARADIGRIEQVVRQTAPPPIKMFVPRSRSVRETVAGLSARFSDVSIALWFLLSLALGGWFAAGVVYWRRARSSWEKTTLDGIDVEVSPETGPAVLGLLSQRIVLPSWATTMAPEHRQLVLAHESEHIRARDPQRLAIALAALIVMPWNIALWWCVARLRRAIELDCDARVLRRFPAVKEYGYVLLEVAARARNSSPLAMPMIGLLSIPSELELRLRAMTRPRSAGARTIAAGGILAFVAVGAAFTTPVPSVRGGRAIAIGRAAARIIASPVHALIRTDGPLVLVAVQTRSRSTSSDRMRENPHTKLMRQTRADTIPAHLADSLAASRRRLDSVQVVLRSLQAETARLARVRSDLETTRVSEELATLLRARRSSSELASAERELAIAQNLSSLPASATANMAATQARLRELVTSAQRAALTRAAPTAMTSIQTQIDHAMKGMYPEIVAHADSAAVIWFVADSAGRVLRTMYNSGAPRPALSVDSLHARFPDVNPGAIQSVTHLDRVFGRRNLSVTWVRLHGDPSRFFKNPK